MVSQSAFNFCDSFFGYLDMWGHTIDVGSEWLQSMVDYTSEDDKVFIMLSHGGCIARGVDPAHVYSLLHGIDAAAEIQARCNS